MKISPTLQFIAFVMALLIVLIAVLIGTFFLTALFYTAIGSTPLPFIVQVINSLLGLFVFVAILVSCSALINLRSAEARRNMGRFEPIFEAMEKIAQGNFKVRLHPIPGNNIFTNELAKSVNQMAVELNQMEHLRQEFIANVSHEIQSPLTSIRGFAQALRNDHLSITDKHHYLTIIETESMRLSRMTDNMLKLATLETEHVKIEKQSYRLDKQMRAIILTCEPQWMHKTIEMDIALDEVEIFANEDLLGQVWTNLIHNSIKFTPENGKIGIQLQQWDKRIECKIIDTGIGIADDAQARIFERFYKADTSRERIHEGSGLGLTIARKIVELHHGTIEVKSQIGTGTTMIVSFPIT